MLLSLIDFIFNFASLLLWLNWLALRFDPLARTSAASLVGTLKKADPSGPRRWIFLVGLVGLLVGRALAYQQIGPAMDWTPDLRLGAIALPFRSDQLRLMLLFSSLGIALTIAIFYLWLLLLSVMNHGVTDNDPVQKLVRLHVAWVERWPRFIKLVLPFLVGGCLWLALHPLLTRLAVIPKARDFAQFLEEAAVLGLAGYLPAKYLIAAVLLLHLLSSYVYLGKHPFWTFINITARNLLAPLSWAPLRLGRVDFAPVAAIALVFLIGEFAARGLTFLYTRVVLS